jgi:CheY-like chemotaxis protein
MESKGSILVVDDDKEFQMLATLILGGQGYDIVGVDNGQAALEYLSTQSAHLIVLDVRMPLMNGLDFLKAYEAMADHPAPIIMVSAVGPFGLEGGAAVSTFLPKPFSPKALRTAVAEYLS